MSDTFSKEEVDAFICESIFGIATGAKRVGLDFDNMLSCAVVAVTKCYLGDSDRVAKVNIGVQLIVKADEITIEVQV